MSFNSDPREAVDSVIEALENEKIELDFQRRADFDFVKRALPGVYLYLLAWPLIFLSTGF